MTAAKTNGYDAEKAKGFIARIEEIEAEKESARGVYMSKCRELKSDQDDVFEEANDAGIPTKILKRVVNTRKLERKVDAIREKLDQDDQDAFDNLRHALGDLDETPLGNAAKRAAGMPGADNPGTASVN